MNYLPIIIDTDPGVDDVVALLYASAAGLPVTALTTVHGNTSIENVTNNALYITQFLKTKPQVYKGAGKSLNGNSYFSTSSGKNGLGSLEIPSQELSTDKDAVEFMAETLQKEKIDLLCLGPLTNIALLMNLHPEVLKNINSITIMAGEFTGKGNITPFAEFNAYCDPSALRIVMDTCKDRKITTYVIPADVCRKALFDKEDLAKLEKLSLVGEIRNIVEPYIDYYLTNQKFGGFTGAVIYDLLVPIHRTNPELFKSSKGFVSVETNQTERHGETSFMPDESSSIELITDVDGSALKEKFFSVLEGSQKARAH